MPSLNEKSHLCEERCEGSINFHTAILWSNSTDYPWMSFLYELAKFFEPMKKVIIESMLLEAKTSKDQFMAECWILTAKTLGACLEVENAGYQMQIKKRNSAGAAESLQQMYVDYSTEQKFWDEVSLIIDAVKNDRSDETGQFYKNVFKKLLPAMQQTLLLEMAEKQKNDKTEQCRYLLLLFKLFPESVAQFGLQLIDLLGEKSSPEGDLNLHENVYNQILVNEIIPLLLKCKELSINESKCFRLFEQTLNFHLCKMAIQNQNRKIFQSPNQKLNSENCDKIDHWHQILQSFLLMAEKCDWKVGKKLKNLRLETLQEILDQIFVGQETDNEKTSIAILIFTYLAYQKWVLDDFKESPDFLIFIPPDDQPDEAPKSKKLKFDDHENFDYCIRWSRDENSKKMARIFRSGLKCSIILRRTKFSPTPTNQIWFRDFSDQVTVILECLFELDDPKTTMGKFSLRDDLKILARSLARENFREALSLCLTKCQKEEILAAKAENCEIVSVQKNAIFTWIGRRDLIFYLLRIIEHCLKIKLNPKIDDVTLGILIILSQYRSNFDFKTFFLDPQRREFKPDPNFLRYIFETSILEYLAFLNFKNKDLILRIADVAFDNKKNPDAYRLVVKTALENQMDKSLEMEPAKVLRDFVVENEGLLSSL